MADSTTSRLTVAAIRLIGAWCLAMNAGVIVRYKGIELGIEAENLNIKDGMVKWTGEWVKLKDFTIRKLTLTTLEADLAFFVDGDKSWLDAWFSQRMNNLSATEKSIAMPVRS